MRYKFCVKNSYVAQTEVAILSYKEKAWMHDQGRNFDPIIFKLGINVGFIKTHIEFVNELCGVNRSSNTFLQIINSIILSRSRNFSPIVSKLGINVGLVQMHDCPPKYFFFPF